MNSNSIDQLESIDVGEAGYLSRLEICSLPDMKERLQRDIDAAKARFRNLNEIPNFELRLNKTSNQLRSLLVRLIQIVNSFQSEVDDTTSVIFNEETLSNSTEVLEYIKNFKGVSISNSLVNNIKTFFAVVKVIAQARKPDTAELAEVLGINLVTQIFRVNKTVGDIDMEKKNKFYLEPKFWL